MRGVYKITGELNSNLSKIGRGLNKNVAFNIYFPLVPASVIVNETLTIIVLSLIYFSNPTYFKSSDNSEIRFWLKAVFLFTIIWIAVVIIHGIYVVGSDPAIIATKGYRQAILLCLAPIVFDYVKCTIPYTKLDPAKMFRTFHIGLLVFLVCKVTYIATIRLGADQPITSLYDLIGLGSGFFEGNRNHFDDYGIIVIIASVWFSVFAMSTSSARHKWQFYFAPILTSAFFLNSIIYSGNRGGWVGFVAAAIFVFLMLIYMRKLKLVLAILLIALTGIFLHFERIEKETTKNWNSIAKLIGLTSEVGEETEKNKPVLLDLTDRCRNGEVGWNDFAMIPDRNTYLRLQIIPFSIEVWLARPWLGYGVYDKKFLAGRHQSKDRCVALFMSHPHNIILHQAIIGGVPFAILVVGMVLFPAGAFVFQLVWLRNAAPLLLPPATYSVYLFVENLFNHSLSNMDLAVLTTLMLTTAISLVLSISATRSLNSVDLRISN